MVPPHSPDSPAGTRLAANGRLPGPPTRACFRGPARRGFSRRFRRGAFSRGASLCRRPVATEARSLPDGLVLVFAILYMVGDTGLEPVTSAMSRQRSSQLS